MIAKECSQYISNSRRQLSTGNIIMYKPFFEYLICNFCCFLQRWFLISLFRKNSRMVPENSMACQMQMVYISWLKIRLDSIVRSRYWIYKKNFRNISNEFIDNYERKSFFFWGNAEDWSEIWAPNIQWMLNSIINFLYRKNIFSCVIFDR